MNNRETTRQEKISAGLDKLKELRRNNQQSPGKNEDKYFNEFTDENSKRVFGIKSDEDWIRMFNYDDWDRRGGKRKSRNRKRPRRTRRR